MKRILAQFFRICPKTGRINGLRPLQKQVAWLFPFVGLAAFIWFLIRVVPKPSRAAYPCQRVAMPLAAGFLSWLLGSSVSTVVLHKLNLPLILRRFINVAFSIIVGIGLLGEGSASASNISSQAYTPHPANSPIGTAKGLMPGRVAWAHDPLVTDWNGTATSSGQSWFNHISQSESTNLMQWALMGYAGTTTTSAAWDAIFHYFNGGSAGYQSGEKIFIKVNMTTTQADACADSNYNWIPSYCGASWTTIGPSPQLMVALLDQLVNVVGVAQSDITIGDSDGLWVNELYNPVHSVFPTVKYLDGRGTLGRTQAKRSTTRLYWSTTEANGKNPDYLLQAIVDAKYMINFALLKTHERNGITLTAKNNFGSLSGGNSDIRKPATSGFYDLHARLPLETESSAWPQRASMAQYRPLVDLNGDTGMGGKTLLYLIDSIFAGEGADPKSTKWTMNPFNNNWPCSLFVSMDEVAIDSVGFDFLSQQFPKYTLAAEGVQDYLHEMALADNPPSGTFYDPEGDGIRMTSQGVHEHWNNAVDKQYSRNLGTGNGIELLYLASAPTCYSLTLRHTGNGLDPTASPLKSAACSTDGQYVEGETITLTATPDPGWQIGSWTGTNGVSSNILTMPASARTAEVTYTQITQTLTTIAGSGGTITAPATSPSTHNYGAVVTITASPNPNYHFVNWTGDMGTVGNVNLPSTTITMNGDYTITANFAIDTYLLSVNKTGTGIGTVTSSLAGIDCGSDCMETYDYGTSVILTATPTDNYNRLVGWSGTGISCPGTGTCTVSMDAAKTVTATFEKSTFGDVPFDYPRWAYIQALYEGGYTSGCSADPLLYCPENTLTRAESAVFMLRGLLGTSYTPPEDPSGYVFGTEDWTPSAISWARPWAEGMWREGLTAGCQADPLKFCPANTLTRAEGSVFGERIKRGIGYTPPAAAHIFVGDDWTPSAISWAEAWAEQAYADGLLLSCGTSPLTFCPSDPLSRSWAAYVVAIAKGLTLP